MVIVSGVFIIYLLLISVAYSFLMVLLTDYFIKNNSYRKAVLLIVLAFLLAVAYAGYLLVIYLNIYFNLLDFMPSFFFIVSGSYNQEETVIISLLMH